MNNNIFLWPIIPFLLLAQAANAESWNYSIGIANWAYEEENIPDLSPWSLEGSANYELGKNMEISANFGLGISTDTEPSPDNALVKLSVEHYYGVYLKPKLEFGSGQLYALLGYTGTRLKGEVEFNGRSASDKDSSSGISYGLGTQLHLSSDSAIKLEWRLQADPSDYELSGFILGYSWNL